MRNRSLATTAAIITLLAGTTLVAMPNSSIFKEIEAVEATGAASAQKAIKLQADIDQLDQSMEDSRLEAEVARRASAPLRDKITRTTSRWITALSIADQMQHTVDGGRLEYLIHAAASPAMRAKLKERRVLDRSDELTAQYRNSLAQRMKITVAFAQASANADVQDATRAKMIENVAPGKVEQELSATDEALHRSLSHLLEYKTERDFHRLKGTLIPPVKKKPIQTFGPQSAGHKVSIRHTGLTYKITTGTAVKASAGGLVVYAHRFEGYGQLVIIDHGQGYHSLYAHLDRVDAKLNTKVVRGSVLGTSGESGSLDGPKLYFELRHQGRAIDPEPWFLQRAQ